MSSTGRYTRTAILLHWAIAALASAQFALGWAMLQIAKNPPGARATAFNLHKSVGVTLLVLMAARLAWRLAHAPPALPAMPWWQERLARTVHITLYAALLALPVTGYLGSEFSGYPVKLFGFALPSWGGARPGLKELMSTLHLAAGWVLAAAVATHLAGAAKHAFIDRDGLARRMTWRDAPPRAAP